MGKQNVLANVRNSLIRCINHNTRTTSSYRSHHIAFSATFLKFVTLSQDQLLVYQAFLTLGNKRCENINLINKWAQLQDGLSHNPTGISRQKCLLARKKSCKFLAYASIKHKRLMIEVNQKIKLACKPVLTFSFLPGQS